MTAWTGPEVIKLRALYVSATWAELCQALPRHEKTSIRARAQSLRLHRKVLCAENDRYASKRHPWVTMLRDRRIALGFSQTELATTMNVDRAVIHHLEGRRSSTLPLTKTLAKWAKALGFKLDLVPIVDVSETQHERTMTVLPETANANPS